MARLHVLASRVLPPVLGLWLGVAVMSGLTAAVAFPALKELDPQLGAFDKYAGEHWPIAAGHVARRVFDLGAIIQWTCATVAAMCAAVLISRRAARPWGAAACVALAAATLVYWRCVLDARMSRSIETYWANARQGDLAAAETARQAFDADHPLAARTLSVLALLVLAGIVETVRTRLDASPEQEPPRQ